MTNFTAYDIWRSTDPDLEGPHCPVCDGVYTPSELMCQACGEEFPEPDYGAQ